MIYGTDKTKSLLDTLFLSVPELEVEVTLIRCEYEQIINAIPEEEQCVFDYYDRCLEIICPHYETCDYAVKEVK